MADPLKVAKQYAAYNNSLYQSNTRQAQAFNAAEAAKNRDWQERLSNSAHQREVADLKKAGLNPVLSSNLPGASTGSGASASSDAAGVDTSMVDAVIDMATAQLNSATQIQTTAMQTAASIANSIRDNDTARWKWSTPSADSTIGQIMNGGTILDNLFGNWSSSKTVNRAKDYASKVFGKNKRDLTKKDITNAFISMSGLTGYGITKRTMKSDRKYKRYGQWNERRVKPKYVVNKSHGIKGSGPMAVYKNTVADMYNSSKKFRNNYQRNQRAMNIHYRKF